MEENETVSEDGEFEIRDLTREADKILAFDMLSEWGGEVVKDMSSHWKAGIAEFTEAFMVAVGHSVSANRIALLMDQVGSVADMMVLTIAVSKIGGLCQESVRAATDKMNKLDDPLATVMEVGDWLSTIMVETTQQMRNDGRRIQETSVHAILAGIWAVTSYLGHNWVIARDTARDECTLCAAKVSDPDHTFLTTFVREDVKKDGEGVDEKD